MTSTRPILKAVFRVTALASFVALIGADSASACHKRRAGGCGQTLVSYVPPTPVGQYGGGCYGGQAMTGGYTSYPMTAPQGHYGIPATGGMVYGGQGTSMMSGQMGQVIGAPGQGMFNGYGQGNVVNYGANPAPYGGNYGPGTFDANVAPTQYGGNVMPGQYGGNIPPGQYGGNVVPGQGGVTIPGVGTGGLMPR